MVGSCERCPHTTSVPRRRYRLVPSPSNEAGGFLIRAIADVKHTFRFASTAPFYVEVGSTANRISRRSAQFFLDWVNERMQRVKLSDPQQRNEVLKYHEQARNFWQRRVTAANAD